MNTMKINRCAYTPIMHYKRIQVYTRLYCGEQVRAAIFSRIRNIR